jgi:acetyl-CoA/propionyl-CoA carboxylase biotin carboxyl carrier protein
MLRSPNRETITVEVDGKRLNVIVPGRPAVSDAAPGRPRRAARRARSGPAGNGLITPMQGTIIKIVVAEGQQVKAGDVVVVLEAMKMEQPLNAHREGTITGLSVEVGQTVTSGEAICQIDG